VCVLCCKCVDMCAFRDSLKCHLFLKYFNLLFPDTIQFYLPNKSCPMISPDCSLSNDVPERFHCPEKCAQKSKLCVTVISLGIEISTSKRIQPILLSFLCPTMCLDSTGTISLSRKVRSKSAFCMRINSRAYG
jgi:hypothetical protein